jgi:hypothetical protein
MLMMLPTIMPSLIHSQNLLWIFRSFLFDSDFSDSEPEQTQVPLTKYEYESSQRRKKVKHCRRAYGPIELIDGLPVKRNMGAQKWRRVENG